MFQPRSLDVDVVLDLMIHDLDLVLDVVGRDARRAVAAVGVAVLSGSEDIANARLEFPTGCVANLTASRVSQERMRKIRFFQGDAYLSLDCLNGTAEIVVVDRAALAQAAQVYALQPRTRRGPRPAPLAAAPGLDGPARSPARCDGADRHSADARARGLRRRHRGGLPAIPRTRRDRRAAAAPARWGWRAARTAAPRWRSPSRAGRDARARRRDGAAPAPPR